MPILYLAGQIYWPAKLSLNISGSAHDKTHIMPWTVVDLLCVSMPYRQLVSWISCALHCRYAQMAERNELPMPSNSHSEPAGMEMIWYSSLAHIANTPHQQDLINLGISSSPSMTADHDKLTEDKAMKWFSQLRAEDRASKNLFNSKSPASMQSILTAFATLAKWQVRGRLRWGQHHQHLYICIIFVNYRKF